MSQIFKDIGLENIDRSFVSRCAAKIDAEVEAWKNRKLVQKYVYIWLDAIYTKVRTNQGVVSVAILVGIDLKEDGCRDVLGFHLGNKESYYNRKEFLQSLKARGLEHCKLWISDDHDGLIKAIEECFPGQLRQRCIVHWMRNAQSKVSRSDLSWLLPLLKDLVGAKSTNPLERLNQELRRRER